MDTQPLTKGEVKPLYLQNDAGCAAPQLYASQQAPVKAALPVQPYQIINNRPVIMNAYGFERAQPLFGLRERTLNDIRGYGGSCASCGCSPGPNIPAHWWDSGSGWVTNFFTNVRPYNPDLKEKGVFQCKVPTASGAPCDFVVENTECCGGPCWCAGAGAPALMRAHLKEAHGFRDPPKREWASDLCCWGEQGCVGCGDVILCAPCHGSRQMMATLGHVDTFNIWWCLFFFFAGCRSTAQDGDSGGANNQVAYWVPPWQLAALYSRIAVTTLQDIDECCPCMAAIFCAPCSLAQTYRELSAAGVWPGGTCFNEQPPAVAMKIPGQMQ